MMIGTASVPTKSSTAAQLLKGGTGPKTFAPLSLLKIPMMYCVAKAAPVGLSPFIINKRILYCFELGATPGPMYSYLISPPMICVAKASETIRKNRQEKRIFFIYQQMCGTGWDKANKNRRHFNAGGLNLLTRMTRPGLLTADDHLLVLSPPGSYYFTIINSGF